MRRRSFGRMTVGAGLLGFTMLASLGCGEQVQEDRTVTWSDNGQATGFQHGDDGVFVADRETGELNRIYVPTDDVLATSTPLWEPGGQRVIFTTAAPLSPQSPTDTDDNEIVLPAMQWDENPTGRRFWMQPVKYSCWIRSDAERDESPAPAALFEASCNHVGYVAANLAVRWHPDGERILYVDQLSNSKHALFEYVIATGETAQVGPLAADALLFDWSPSGDRLACVLYNNGNTGQKNGIWIGQPGSDDWWHVPRSGFKSVTDPTSVLNVLRAARPIWRRDGSSFAMTSSRPARSDDDARELTLHLVDPKTRSAERLFETNEPVTDLHWSADGKTLGFLRGSDSRSLHLFDLASKSTREIHAAPVRQFAGWDANGKQMAYTLPEAIPHSDGDHWALFVEVDREARDRVCVTDAAGTLPNRAVLSGLRVTFPNWSPNDEKLSLWATFMPTHHSWFSRIFGGGLRPGDPAAVLDMRTGHIEWLAVNAREQMQIGHYHLLKQNYDEALRWYEKAREKLPAVEPLVWETWILQLRGTRLFPLFHAHCLEKLGREIEAAAARDLFRKSYQLPEFLFAAKSDAASEQLDADVNQQNPDQDPADDPRDDPAKQQPSDFHRVREQMELLVALAREMSAFEVFLSLDAIDDGKRHFQRTIDESKDRKDVLSSAMALAQLHLLKKEYRQYVDLATDTIVPQLATLWETLPMDTFEGDRDTRTVPNGLMMASMMTLLPLYSSEFHKDIPREQLEHVVDRWVALRETADSDVVRLGIDLFLEKAFGQLGNDEQQQLVSVRLQHNEQRTLWLADQDIEQGIAELRKQRATATANPR